MPDDEIAIVYHSGPDQQGRYTFTMLWWADYHPGHPAGEYRRAQRGQVFFARPHGFIERARARGARVVERRS